MSATSLKQRRRSDYLHFSTHSTRWSDDNELMHVNQAVFNDLLVTVIITYLKEQCSVDVLTSPILCFLIELRWQFFAPVAFPDSLDLGIRVNKLGKSSVEYEAAVFVHGKDTPAAIGTHIYAWFEKESGKTISMPKEAREGLQKLYRAPDTVKL